MKKFIILTTIIVSFSILQACSKKDISAPTINLADYVGFWAGRRLGPRSRDSIQFNVKDGLLVDGKVNVKPDGTFTDSVRGNWGINKDTLLIFSYIVGTGFMRRFSAKLSKDSLKGKAINDSGDVDSFYLARKK